MLKAQHPEFEMYNQGIHARSGVACADCHMPYKREGAMKISDHHVRSPLLNINRACQTCHKWSEEELQGARRDDPGAHLRAAQPRDGRGAAAHRRHRGRRSTSDSTRPQIAQARDYQRKAQFLADFIEAENSMGFHADRKRRACSRCRSTTRDAGRSRCAAQEPPPVTNPAKGGGEGVSLAT